MNDEYLNDEFEIDLFELLKTFLKKIHLIFLFINVFYHKIYIIPNNPVAVTKKVNFFKVKICIIPSSFVISKSIPNK